MSAEIILQAIINGLMMGGVYAVIAVGLTLIFGVMNVVNFAHGEFVMLGMVITYLCHSFLGLDPGVSILLVIPVMLVVGAVIQKTLISRVVGQPDEAQILLTLGLSVLITNLALLFMGPDYRSVKTAYKLSVWSVGPLLFSVPRVIAFVVAMAFSGILWLFLTRTDLGRGLRAVAEKPEVATLMGINPRKMHWLAFGIGISLAAGAGSVLTPFFYTFPSVGGMFVLTAFVVVVLGGMGNIPGAILGALAIGVTESLTSQFIALDLAMLGVFIIFVLVLVFKPSGILGKGKVY
ncbi:MAG TPA: branched-chain amino acid ABC transporter permease [Thermodesulfobacteriota bacterium]|nr:branched-chain amino acid ABC transporter permease [Thermodesulfobacteriota bacterium]